MNRYEEYASHGIRHAVEVAVVKALFQECQKADFHVASVFDGDGDVEMKTEIDALNLIFDLDDCWVHFRQSKAGGLYGVRIVLGNEGPGAISDWICSNSEFDGAVKAAVKRSDNIQVTC